MLPSSPFLACSPEAVAWITQHRRLLVRWAQYRGADWADAEDIAQEVSSALVRHWHRFDPARGSRTVWIKTMTRNATVDWLRHERRHRHEPLPEAAGGDAATETDDDWTPGSRLREGSAVVGGVGDAERDALLRLEIARSWRFVSPQDRPYVLALATGQTCDQIAARYGVPVGTLKSRLYRLRHRVETLETQYVPA